MSRWLKCVSFLAGGLTAVANAGLVSRAVAQDGAMTELYGYGVHRYYAGDYAEAHRVLNLVVDAGIIDPRPHYFRGLTQHQLGMLDAAHNDFVYAAELEAHGRRAVNVAYALQRVQGPVRQEIEMARMMARVAVYREQVANGQRPADGRYTPPNIPTSPSDGVALPPGFAPPVGAPPVPFPPVTPPPVTLPEVTAPDMIQPVVPVIPESQVDPFRDDATAPPTPMPPTTRSDRSKPFGTEPESPVPAAPVSPLADPSDPFNAPPTSAAPVSPLADPASPFGTPAAPDAPASPVTPPPASGVTDPFAP